MVVSSYESTKLLSSLFDDYRDTDMILWRKMAILTSYGSEGICYYFTDNRNEFIW